MFYSTNHFDSFSKVVLTLFYIHGLGTVNLHVLVPQLTIKVLSFFSKIRNEFLIQ